MFKDLNQIFSENAFSAFLSSGDTHKIDFHA